MRTLIGSLLAAVAFFPASALAQQVERRDDLRHAAIGMQEGDAALRRDA